MELFFFDIETAGNYPNYSEFKNNDKKGSDLFLGKYQKMWKDDYSIEDAYLNNSPIISTYGRIVCISYGFIQNDGTKFIKSISDDNEEEIIIKFNKVLEKVQSKQFKLSGYRIFYFDIPWFLHKCHKYKIKPAQIICPYNTKPWDMRVVDLSDDWKGKFAWSFNFDEMIYELGLESPKDKMSGSDVHSKFWSGDLSEIVEYCERDVKSCIEASNILYL
jgi:predicted PolB exonuclease-like 3'-5' exonuclease